MGQKERKMAKSRCFETGKTKVKWSRRRWGHCACVWPVCPQRCPVVLWKAGWVSKTLLSAELCPRLMWGHWEERRGWKSVRNQGIVLSFPGAASSLRTHLLLGEHVIRAPVMLPPPLVPCSRRRPWLLPYWSSPGYLPHPVWLPGPSITLWPIFYVKFLLFETFRVLSIFLIGPCLIESSIGARIKYCEKNSEQPRWRTDRMVLLDCSCE